MWPKVVRSAPGVNGPLFVYCAAFLLLLLGVWAAIFGLFVALMLLMALMVHEAAHAWALGKRRASPGLLFVLPFTGLLRADSSDEFGLAERVGVTLAGPMAGLLGGVLLLLANCLWPSRYLPGAAAVFIGLNVFLLIPFPGTDGARILSAASAPGSMLRPLGQLLSVIVVLAVGIYLQSAVLNSFGFVWGVYFLSQLSSFNLTRKIARQIPPGSNWDEAVRAALSAMTGPQFGRWSAPIRQMRAISIANELTRPISSRREQAVDGCLWLLCGTGSFCGAAQFIVARADIHTGGRRCSRNTSATRISVWVSVGLSLLPATLSLARARSVVRWWATWCY
jgi:hypothetical protein